MRCPTCIHPEGYDRLGGPCPTCGGDGVLPPGIWQARHVESGATVACCDRAEAEGHVRESASGPWVAELSVPAQARCSCVPGICAEEDECCENHECRGTAACDHEWLDRPESDTRECLADWLDEVGATDDDAIAALAVARAFLGSDDA